MKVCRWLVLVFLVALASVAQGQSGKKHDAMRGAAWERLIGAWHLVEMEEPGADGTLHRVTDRTGMLVYTRDGHMSVQLMYPKEQSGISNEYVQNGYEASFGEGRYGRAAVWR